MMRRAAQRVAAMTVLVALSGALAGCGGNMFSSLDPTDLIDFLDTKKKLPGDRKAVFPQGVPGIEQGVPRELYKGANAQQEEAPTVVQVPPEPKPNKKAAKARSSVNAKSAARTAPAAAPVPAAPVQEAAPPDADAGGPDSEEGVAVAPPAPPPPKIKRSRSTSLPREPAAAAPPSAPQQEANSPFPNPTRAGTFSR